jgi:hypothetical protein
MNLLRLFFLFFFLVSVFASRASRERRRREEERLERRRTQEGIETEDNLILSILDTYFDFEQAKIEKEFHVCDVKFQHYISDIVRNGEESYGNPTCTFYSKTNAEEVVEHIITTYRLKRFTFCKTWKTYSNQTVLKVFALRPVWINGVHLLRKAECPEGTVFIV